MARNELEAIEEAHRAAQARIGIAGAYLTLAEWMSGVSVVNPVATGVVWTAAAIRVVAALRRKSRRLTQSYYQLARALETGETMGDMEGAEPAGSVKLSALRKAFLDQLLDVASLGREVGLDTDETAQWFDKELTRMKPDHDVDSVRGASLARVDLGKYVQQVLDYTEKASDIDIAIEAFPWPTDTDEDLLRRTLEPHFKKMLADMKAEAAKALDEPDEVSGAPGAREKALANLLERKGNTMAGEVQRLGAKAGRDTQERAINRDGKVKAVARQTGPNPCAFCAMLASRGFVYKSEASATSKTTLYEKKNGRLGFTLDKYHDNCGCTAITRWVASRQSDLPELNQFFDAQWPIVTKGYKGVDALNAWRRWLNARRREETI